MSTNYFRVHNRVGSLAVVQNKPDVVTDTEDRQDSKERTLLFKVDKFFEIPSNIDASVSVTSSSPGRIYMAPHPNSIETQIVLPASGIVNAIL